MDFSSIPAYLDPANWQQQPNYQSEIGGSNSQLQPIPQPPPPSLPPPPQAHAGGGPGSIRPGSMVDRARMANLPMPETALKCPRCESTNTKFCYFNNYSLSQPRHFCKTCRRYWTRGGSLRSVPVGGGCRRNKRTKGNNSKSPASSGDRQSAPSTSTCTTHVPSSSGNTAHMLSLTSQFPQLRFISPPGHHTPDYGPGDIGLNYSGISAPAAATSEMNFGGLLFGGNSGGGNEQWRLQQPQQYPFFGGLEAPPQGLYQFQSGGEPSDYVGGKISNPVLTSQMGSVKVEESNREPNFSRQFLGVNTTGNDQWSAGTNAWTELSGFSSSSTSNNPL